MQTPAAPAAHDLAPAASPRVTLPSALPTLAQRSPSSGHTVAQLTFSFGATSLQLTPFFRLGSLDYLPPAFDIAHVRLKEDMRLNTVRLVPGAVRTP